MKNRKYNTNNTNTKIRYSNRILDKNIFGVSEYIHFNNNSGYCLSISFDIIFIILYFLVVLIILLFFSYSKMLEIGIYF